LFNMREGTALKALQLLERYVRANFESHDHYMLIYVAEATLYIAAKMDEANFAVSFEDFHEALLDFPAYLDLIKHAKISSSDLTWSPPIYSMLERSIMQTLRWRLNVVSPIDILVTLLTIRTRISLSCKTSKFFSASSFGSLGASDCESFEKPDESALVE